MSSRRSPKAHRQCPIAHDVLWAKETGYETRSKNFWRIEKSWVEIINKVEWNATIDAILEVDVKK